MEEKRLFVWFPVELYKKLEKMAKEKDMSVSAYVRSSVKEMVRRHELELKNLKEGK